MPHEPLAWLLAVARNECYERFRQRAGTPVPTGETPEAATADASVHMLRVGELASVWDEVGRLAAEAGVGVRESELIGLAPLAAFLAVADRADAPPDDPVELRLAAAADYLRLRDFSPMQALELRLATARARASTPPRAHACCSK